jgi:hypothetical protein
MKSPFEEVEEGAIEVWYECKDGCACGFFGCNQHGVRHRHMVKNHRDEHELAVDLAHLWYKFPDQRLEKDNERK